MGETQITKKVLRFDQVKSAQQKNSNLKYFIISNELT